MKYPILLKVVPELFSTGDVEQPAEQEGPIQGQQPAVPTAQPVTEENPLVSDRASSGLMR